MNNIFNISFANLVRQYLNWRIGSWQWMMSATTCIQIMHSTFISFRQQSIYKLSHGSQKLYLEKALNDGFDNYDRRIYIDNATIREPIWFYEVADNKPVLFYEEEHNRPVYFREEIDLIGSGIDFTVFIPIALRPIYLPHRENFENRVKALVDYYKLYSKNYEIQYY